MADGRSTEYDSLKAKDVVEFFHLLEAYQTRLKKAKPKNGKGSS